MKYITIIFVLLFLGLQTMFGQQTKTDTLTMKKNRVLLNNAPLNHKALKDIFNANPDTKKIMQSANTNYNVAMAFNCVGGFCIGYGLMDGILGNKAGWIVAGAGVGIALFSIPFTSAYNRHIKNAVEIYNEQMIRQRPVIIKFGMLSTGVGLKMAF